MGDGAIKSEPPEAEEPRAMQKVPSLSDLSDPEASLGESTILESCIDFCVIGHF